MLRRTLALALGLAAACGCATRMSDSAVARDGAQLQNAAGGPLPGLSAAEQAAFATGQAAFTHAFSDQEGIGPLFTDRSCAACHAQGGKGPGFVGKMAVLDGGGALVADPSALLPFGQTVHPNVAGGGRTPILPPSSLAAPNQLLVTRRFGPALFGRGMMEAVLDSEILRVAAEQAQRGDGIAGQVNTTTYASADVPLGTFTRYQHGAQVIGRFGTKARIGTLDDFSADALQNDMGLTTPMRPTEIPNPDGLTDDAHPGIDLSQQTPEDMAQVARLLAIPPRQNQDNGGAQIFAAARCAECHVPTLHTDPRYPVAAIADIDAPLFTDMLVHDMGSALADGIPEGQASGRAWRTAPLIGLRLMPNFLHDGRAASVADAIAQHRGPGSEANGSIDQFDALSAHDRALLLEYVQGL